MDKPSRIWKVIEFCEWAILNYSRDKFSRKREKFIYLAKVNPINVA